MKQEAFEAKFSPTWDTFEEWIAELSAVRRPFARDSFERAAIGRRFPAMYRQVCHHLALARTRRYSIGLQQRLNQLALDGHQHLYRSRAPFFGAIGRFLANDFPAAFRRRWRYMLTSALAFYVPAIGMTVAMQVQPELVFSMLEPFEVSQIEAMYDPANSVLGRERESDTDIKMFGFYIYNNISLGFQTFADILDWTDDGLSSTYILPPAALPC